MKQTEELKKQVDEAAGSELNTLNLEELDAVTGGFDANSSNGPLNCSSCGKPLPAPKFRTHPSLCHACFLNIIFQPKRPQ